MFHIIGFIIVGFIVGLVARAIRPGNDRMSVLLTTVLGMTGAIVAGWAGRAVGWYGPEDGAGLVVSTLGAIIVLTVYSAFTRRRRHLSR